VSINVFGLDAATVKAANDAECEVGARALYQKCLLSDTGCAELTSRMLDKMASMSAGLKAEMSGSNSGSGGVLVKNMMDFTFDFVYRASVAALFNSAVADDQSVYEAFKAFDSAFALGLAGAPVYSDLFVRFFPASPAAGRERTVDALVEALDNSGPFISARVAMYREARIDPRSIARYQAAMLWAGAGNTMPGKLDTISSLTWLLLLLCVCIYIVVVINICSLYTF
jgi:hypothetical protein